MKRFLVALFVLFLTVSCSNHKGPESDGSGFVKADFKRVTIAVSQSGGGYVIEEPVPSEATYESGRKVKWTILNNTNEEIEQVEVRGFNANGDNAPFEGAASDQIFKWTSIPPGEESEKQSNKTKALNSGETKSYKYTIEVWMKNGNNPPPKDPRIIVSG